MTTARAPSGFFATLASKVKKKSSQVTGEHECPIVVQEMRDEYSPSETLESFKKSCQFRLTTNRRFLI